MADKKSNPLMSVVSELPVDRLKKEVQHGLGTLGEKAISSAGDKLTDLTDRLNDAASNGGIVGKAVSKGAEEASEGGSPVKGALKGGLTGAKDKVKEKLGGGGGGGKKGTKSTNFIDEIDIGAPIDLVYNQWTQFQDYSGFMKKVDNVEQQDEVKVNFKAQVFWSHRQWEATILEQVPNERIVWRSKGEKGHVDGSVTFHELAPTLTRVLVNLEYYPQGLFERTGNIWRAQNRRARLELKHFRRHVMNHAILDADEIEGWRGEIRDGEVVRDHDEVVEEEEREQESGTEDEYDEPESDEQDEDEGDEGQPEDEYEDEEEPEDDEGEAEDEYEEGEEPEDEYEDEEEPDDDEPEDDEEEDEPEDEYEEEEEEEEEEDLPRRRRAS